MNRAKIIGVPVILLILELLPFSAVERYSDLEGGRYIKELTSCFSLTAYQNGNYGPFITAMLSILTLLLAVLLVLVNKQLLRRALTGVSAAGLLTALFTITCTGWAVIYATILGAVLPFLFLYEIVLALCWDVEDTV